MIDLKPFMARAKRIANLKTDGQFATHLGLRPQQFIWNKRYQTLLPFLVDWAQG